ncbi:MAG TPA: hypothetical protein VIV11_09215 [Kofleriaceae bacterium]
MRWVLLLGLLVGCRFGFDPPPTQTDALTGDARVPSRDAGTCSDTACVAAGGDCVDNVCTIISSSEDPVVCPVGMPCRLICSGYRTCRDGASCGGATWCDVACLGYRTCQYGVDCAGAECFVTCNGEEACEDGIRVGAGGTCTSHCCGTEACLAGTASCANDNTCS